MKKRTLVLTALCTGLLLTACGGTATQTTETSAATAAVETTAAEGSESSAAEESIAEVPNPMVEVKSAAELETLGVKMEAPEGAESVTYFTIDQEVAEINFTMNGLSYCYRGSATAEEFAGIFEEFEEKEDALSDSGADDDVRIRTTVSKGRLADWKMDGKNYTLYTPGPAETGDIQELCVKLIALQK